MATQQTLLSATPTEPRDSPTSRVAEDSWRAIHDIGAPSEEDAPVEIPRSCSVAVQLRLVGAGHVNAEVLSLLLGELGEADT